MKKYWIYTMILACMGWMSCDFLETDALDQLEADKPYSTEAEVKGGLAGVYAILGSEHMYGSYLWEYYEGATDLLIANRNATTDMRVYTFNYSNAELGNTWIALYAGIGRANSFIQQMESVDPAIAGGESMRAAYIGEARAIRALHYLNLVTLWGGVPIKSEPTKDLSSLQIPRSSEEEVYNFIVEDLKYAKDNCLNPIQLQAPGRVSNTTAAALLARTYMYMSGYPLKLNKWKEMYEAASFVEGSGFHDLNTNGYADVFKRLCSDEYDLDFRESMWEVEFYGNHTDGGYTLGGKLGGAIGIQQQLALPAGMSEQIGYAYGLYDATPILNNLYLEAPSTTTTDERRSWNIANYKYDFDIDAAGNVVGAKKTPITDFSKGGKAAKWRREYEKVFPKNKNYTPNNFPLVRYSEVLLMLAESSLEYLQDQGKALEYLKLVRDRARAKEITSGDYSGAEELKQIIYDERARELCFECLRKGDLRRQGMAPGGESVLVKSIKGLSAYFTDVNAPGYRIPRNIQERHLYYPIPEAEMSVNKAITNNNPGW